jgi:branched-subunit amino acid transport protein
MGDTLFASSSLLAVVLVGAAASYMWRALGVALSGRIDADGPVVRWVGCVAYAVLAALIARMILLPVGSLGDTPVSIRLVAAALALGVFYLARRHLLIGVLTGGISLTLLSFWTGK